MLRDDVQAISVDDHVIEPAHVFADHIEPRFRDRAPRIVERDGEQGWLWEDRWYPLLFQGNAATRKFRAGEAGRGDDLYARRYDDMIPAAYDVHELPQDVDRRTRRRSRRRVRAHRRRQRTRALPIPALVRLQAQAVGAGDRAPKAGAA
ncbi:MAG: hypothetical protein SGJ13_04645 [Actinomycetota bacterium]|nr:hypothetical protein [Actinomycetota bacterium]